MHEGQRAEFAQRVQRVMAEHGFAYVKGIASEDADEAECEVAIRESVPAIGVPSAHDLGGQHLWRITYKDENSVVPTYSQHNGIAGGGHISHSESSLGSPFARILRKCALHPPVFRWLRAVIAKE